MIKKIILGIGVLCLSVGMVLNVIGSTPGGTSPLPEENCISYKIDSNISGTYYHSDLEIQPGAKQELNQDIWIEIEVSETDQGQIVQWDSNYNFTEVSIKGGTSHLFFTTEQYLHAPVNPNNDKYYDISNITFYLCIQPEPTQPTTQPTTLETTQPTTMETTQTTTQPTTLETTQPTTHPQHTQCDG